MSERVQLCKMYFRQGKYGDFYSGRLGMGNITLSKSKNGDWWNLQIRPKEDETQQPQTQPENNAVAQNQNFDEGGW